MNALSKATLIEMKRWLGLKFAQVQATISASADIGAWVIKSDVNKTLKIWILQSLY